MCFVLVFFLLLAVSLSTYLPIVSCDFVLFKFSLKFEPLCCYLGCYLLNSVVSIAMLFFFAALEKTVWALSYHVSSNCNSIFSSYLVSCKVIKLKCLFIEFDVNGFIAE